MCTATNQTPHERFFVHQLRSSKANSIPSWLASPRKVLMKRNVRASKHEPLVDEVDLIDANPHYAHVRLSNGRETTVSTRQLAPYGEQSRITSSDPVPSLGSAPNPDGNCRPVQVFGNTNETRDVVVSPDSENEQTSPADIQRDVERRRSSRVSKPPDRLTYS